jgi:uncharacterized protein YbaR (Trm112 family)
MQQELLKYLACPECKTKLDFQRNENKLFCPTCKISYKIENGIPVLKKTNP